MKNSKRRVRSWNRPGMKHGLGLVAVVATSACGAPVEVEPVAEQQDQLPPDGLHGFMLVSDGDVSKAIVADGFPVAGVRLKLSQSRGCTWSNPFCTWTYFNGALKSDADSSLCIKTSSTPTEGETLTLGTQCGTDLSGSKASKWIYREGRFISALNPSFAIHSQSSVLSPPVVLKSSCTTSSSNNCRFTIQSAMIKTVNTGQMAMSVWDGPVDKTSVRLWDGCTRDDPQCTWSFRRGLVQSDADPRLALWPSEGAHHGAWMRVNKACTESDPNCLWTLRDGLLLSGDTQLATIASNGPVNASLFRVVNNCTETNLKARDPNCNIVIHTAGHQCGGLFQAPCTGGVCVEGTLVGALCKPIESRVITCPSSGNLSVGSVTATTTIGISNTGHWMFNGHVHNGGIPGMNYSAGFVFNDTIAGLNLGAVNSGVVGGTFNPDPRSEDFSVSGIDARIVDGWETFKTSGLQCKLHTSVNPWLVGQQALAGLGFAIAGTVIVLITMTGGNGCEMVDTDDGGRALRCPAP